MPCRSEVNHASVFWTGGGGGFGVCGLGAGSPFDAKEVSADAKWAAHLDVDGLLASHLVKTVREQVLKEHPDIEAKLAVFRSLFHFDPMTDLHGVTVYGAQLKKDTGVAVIHAKVDQELLLNLVKTNPDHAATTYGKFELHTWRKGAKQHDHAAFFKPDVIVFAASTDELKAALDVLDGTKPNLGKAYESLASSIPPGAILLAGRETWPQPICTSNRRCRSRSIRPCWWPARIRARCSSTLS